MKKTALSRSTLALAIAAALAQPALAQAPADDAEQLKRQLEAQRNLNELLRQRVDTLEKQLTDERGNVTGGALDPTRPAPRADLDGAPNSAVEQALVSRGVVLLPSGMSRLTPSLSWAQSGPRGESTEATQFGLGMEAGLPAGMSVSARVPYVWLQTPSGSNEGTGDLVFSLAKKLNNETATTPSFVARLTYESDTGDYGGARPAIGSGFQSWGLSLSGVKRFDPVVGYGTVFFNQAITDAEVSGGKVERGDFYGFSLGMSLAATPDVSLDAGVSLGFGSAARFVPTSGPSVEGSSSRVGYVDLGTNILLTQRLTLSITASAGVTSDAADFIFSIALPYRF